jgi:hypothetical protein
MNGNYNLMLSAFTELHNLLIEPQGDHIFLSRKPIERLTDLTNYFFLRIRRIIRNNKSWISEQRNLWVTQLKENKT